MVDIIRISRERLRFLTHRLKSLHRPLIQEADLAMCLLGALKDTKDLEKDVPPADLKAAFKRARKVLLEFGGIEPFPDSKHTYGYLVGIAEVPEPEPALCSLDPFAYVSHLSAMAWHGLTDRVPNTLFATRPSAGLWRTLSEKRLQGELGDNYQLYRDAGFPQYQRLAIQKLNHRPLNIWSSSRLDKAYQSAYKKVADGRVRLATVGRCFLDMVREPALCGGIYHVMQVFEEHGEDHVESILSEVDRHGNKIEQARVGYLLEQANPERAHHEILQRWAKGVTRGGSRKLDPGSDYADQYSEKWALSINV